MAESLAPTMARGEEGATAVEYGLMVAAIAALVVLIVFALGGIVSELFGDTCDEFDAQPTISTTCP